MAENDPLMEEEVGVRNTTRQFLRSFSEFDELDEPDTPGDYLDGGPVDGGGAAGGAQVRHTVTSGLTVEQGKPAENSEGKVIPFSTIHKERKGFTHIRKECWMNLPISVKITDIQREEHPHMTRKALNPNLYTIEVTHGEFTWTVKRRYKHFDSLHNALRLFRARYTLPMPTRQHRETRQSIKEERKERKIKKRQAKNVSRFPKKLEIMVSGDKESLQKRGEHLEQYLQSIIESKWYRNHTELLKFLEVSELSFINRLGSKWKEGDINKCSGGRRISIGCCGCLKKYHVAGRWSSRWLLVKDTFIAYTRPRDGVICDVMLMDSDFKVESGMRATGAPHGLLVQNLSRCLLAKCWTSRKADEWEAGIKEAATTTGSQFTEPTRYNSYAPVRDKSYARWFVDGATYFEAVADALEKAKEEIFITDWWLSPEIYLKRHVTDRENWRLDVILARKAKAGVKVFILLYKELEIALTINSHYSKHALMSKCPENIKVIRHPDHVAGGNRVLLWAHHEKMVVIDQKTSFLGGLDMCYGRWDDEQHRMTDFGSVTYKVNNTRPTTTDTVSANGDRNAMNGSAHKQKYTNKKKPVLKTQPSTIMESPENESLDLSETNDSKEKLNIEGAHGDETAEDAILTRPDDGHTEEDKANARNSLCSEQDFGSGDILTDNDSLENEGKMGYSNVVAEVMVHRAGSGDSRQEECQPGGDDVPSASQGHVGEIDSNIEHSVTECNKSIQGGTYCTDSSSGDTGNGNNIVHTPKHISTPEQTVSLGEIELEENTEYVDIEKIEKQIITSEEQIENYSSARDNKSVTAQKGEDGKLENAGEVSEQCSKTANKSSQQGGNSKDLNENQTKGPVRFREEVDGQIHEERILPVSANLVEGSPKGKKDAAAKRETWASMKLRKTFRLRVDKTDEDDQVDGKDKSDSDDENGGGRLRNKWRMVLNIKKLEHAGKKSDDEDDMPPESPYSKTGKTGLSPHPSLSTRIRQSMPFRTQRRNSDEDLYYNLYPWKRFRRRDRDDGGPVQVRSIMKTSVADDYEGLEGSSKLWIGKDYVNFIHKDPVDVHNPFEDFIERDKTPRMPWHDIGAVVYGKPALDVARHFIRRWNFCKTMKFKTNKNYPLLMPKEYSKCEVAPAIKEITYEVSSQILRSVSGWSAGINQIEKSIHTAYIDCIKNAKHYIYIENQFFISQINDHSLVKNGIGEALLERIERAYKEKETFRVYVVLPLLPAFEGEIGENGGYAIQAVLHWNCKSISKGENSLWAQLQHKVDDPKKYIIFCGLRTHAELNGKLVTELVYVHSKLMIVDDDTVIIGSANINDRSMLGTRDSEMAVLVQDTQTFPVTWAGKQHMAGRFASSLRRTLFREHLGIGELQMDIDLTDPVCDSFYKLIWLNQASINTTIYHRVFKCIPDDHIKTFAEVKQISQSPTMAETDPAAAREELKKVKGRLVLMPLYFLEYEESIMAVGANKEAVMPMKLWL